MHIKQFIQAEVARQLSKTGLGPTAPIKPGRIFRVKKRHSKLDDVCITVTDIAKSGLWYFYISDEKGKPNLYFPGPSIWTSKFFKTESLIHEGDVQVTRVNTAHEGTRYTWYSSRYKVINTLMCNYGDRLAFFKDSAVPFLVDTQRKLFRSMKETKAGELVRNYLDGKNLRA